MPSRTVDLPARHSASPGVCWTPKRLATEAFLGFASISKTFPAETSDAQIARFPATTLTPSLRAQLVTPTTCPRD